MLSGWSRADKIRLVIAILICGLLCVVGLVGCGHPNQLHSGKVIEKSYDDPDDWYVPGYYTPGTESCSGGYGNVPRSCYTTPGYYTPGYYEHDGPHWYLRITGTTKDGKVVTETHEVDSLTYDRARIGVFWEE